MRITALDHLVITVRDVEATCHFYQTVLQMETITFGTGRRALRFGQQKVNLHIAGAEIAPHAARPTPGSVDLCFLTDVPIDKVVNHVRRKGVEITEGPVSRTGSVFPLGSVYFRDPDGNLIEVANELY